MFVGINIAHADIYTSAVLLQTLYDADSMQFVGQYTNLQDIYFSTYVVLRALY